MSPLSSSPPPSHTLSSSHPSLSPSRAWCPPLDLASCYTTSKPFLFCCVLSLSFLFFVSVSSSSSSPPLSSSCCCSSSFLRSLRNSALHHACIASEIKVAVLTPHNYAEEQWNPNHHFIISSSAPPPSVLPLPQLTQQKAATIAAAAPTSPNARPIQKSHNMKPKRRYFL